MVYEISETKTDAVKRLVPMNDSVAECFRRIINNRPTPKIEPIVDGRGGFLFLDK